MSLKLKAAALFISALTSFVYLLNPGAGLFELLPDALPLVGNLDEAAFVTILLASVRGLRRLGKESKAQQPAQAQALPQVSAGGSLGPAQVALQALPPQVTTTPWHA
jgi:uncharacterized membrane protein YkvA (DUF1232 family)